MADETRTGRSLASMFKATAALVGGSVGALAGLILGAVWAERAAEHALEPPAARETAAAPQQAPAPEPLRPALHPGWSRPRPDVLPSPTYTPVVFALGIIFIALGVVTNYIVSFVGLLLFLLGAARWIGELRHEC